MFILSSATGADVSSEMNNFTSRESEADSGQPELCLTHTATNGFERSKDIDSQA